MSVSVLRAALFVLLSAVSTQALAAKPVATTSAATGITSSSAVLNGIGTPSGEATTGRFRYSSTDPGTCNDTFGTRVPAVSGTDLGSGASAVPYSITTTGLVPGTTYYFCAIVSNASGTAFGSVLSFTIPSTPVVTTAAATSVTSSSAVLQGAANPVAASTTAWFRYSMSSPGVCDDSFGTRAPSGSGSASLGSGIVAVSYSQSVSGLSPGVTYYYCAIATNTYGTKFGALMSFTTPAAPPTVTTSSATNLTRTTGTLTGYANPGGDATTAWFRYSVLSPGTCNDTFGTRAPSAGGTSLGSGTMSTSFSQNISGLLPATTYYYCAIASNAAGLSWGAVYTFTTPTAPTALTTPASSITNTSAMLNGSGNPNRSNATGWFRYATSDPGTCDDKFGSRAPVTGSTSLGNDIYDYPYSQPISGLSPSTTYYYCAIVASTEGTAFGTVMTFTTSSPPVVATAAATSVAANSATLNGTGSPGGGTTYAWFRYGTTNPGTCNDGYGNRAPSSGSGVSLGSGTLGVPFGQPISGLVPGTLYYYCAIATNNYGTSYGAVMTFTTPATAPTVSTSSATNLTKTTGTLTGYGNPGGDATTGWFRFSLTSPGTCNDTFGTRAPAAGGSALGSGTSNTSFSQPITGLAPATTYYYCALASNAGGTVLGAVYSFTTPSAPTATTVVASSVTTSSAMLNGSGNPNRANTQGWFRYSATNPGTCDDKFGSRAPVTGTSALGNDIYDYAYSQPISGLSSGATYYYCAIVASSEGTAFGAVLSFTTSGIAVATTSAATSLSPTGATLNGAGNPNGGTAYGWFRYSTTDPGTCNDGYGNRAPSSGSGVSLGAGTAAVSFGQTISGLTPGTKYYFCAIASNSYGTGYGAVLTFTTPSTAPTVTTSSATNLTKTTGTLTGYGNPGGDATTGWFRFSLTSPGTCNDTFGTRAPTAGGSAMGAGSTNTSYSQPITGLAPATTYYYCALAANANGMALGAVYSFTTPSAPTATTVVASSVTTNSAMLNGSGNPNRANAQGWFRYSATNPGTCDDKFGSRAPVTGASALGNDIYDYAYSQPISGLSSGTTYYYCAIVASSEGTAFGAVLSFTTAGIAVATTSAATSLSPTGATLNGTGNPNFGTAYGWFRYSTTDPGTCNDGFGNRAPSSGSGVSLGSGTAAVSFAQTISGLVPGTTYYYCAIASNSYGMGYGAVLTFTTPSTAPTVTTSSATNLTKTTGTLTGYGNPGGDATTGWFRFSLASPGTCNDTFGTRAPAAGGSAMGAGATNTSFSQPITGLAPATTYYYCALAANANGLALGAVYSFTTPSAPTAQTTPASGLTNSSAMLNGAGNPNRANTQGWFRYSATNPGTCDDKFGSRAPVTGASPLGNDIYDYPYSQAVGGLSSGTTYYYCAIVSSTEGTAFGAVLSFTTASAATATTVAATGISSTGATINGSGNPSAGTTYAWLRYSTTDPGTCNDGFGNRAPSSGSGVSLGSGSASVSFSQSISGLTPGTKYYFCAIANNNYGTGYGAVLTFTTPATAPTVTTSSATNLTKTTGTLTGYGNPGGDATTGWFRFSASSPGTCNDTFGTRAPAAGGSALGSGTSNTSFSQPITGLAPATTYYYCALAANGSGTAWGAVYTFTTPTAPTALTTPASSITTNSAALNGAGNPNRGNTQGWFRYATTNPGTCNDTFGSRAPVTGGTPLGNDIYDYPYSQAITGLSPATTYYYCAIVASTEGTAFGMVLSFTTSAPATAVTNAATAVASTTATLNGAGNPNGGTATGWFRYSATNPGTCTDTFGTRTPSGSSGLSLGAGSTNVAFGQPITGLSPGVTYYYCAIVSNSYGTGLGAVLSFTTPASLPTVVTDSISGLATNLNGSANPNGSATTGWFRIATSSPGTCNDTFGTRMPAAAGTVLGAGSSFVSFSNPTTGLVPGTTYYYCAIAANALGTSFGVVRSFTAPMAPTIATLAATPVTSTTATLNGSGNPNGNSTIAWFRYSTSSPGTCNDVFGTRTPATGGTSLGAGSSATPFSENITGLAPATTYYFCAIASSAFGTTLGSVLSFTTPPSAPATGGGGGSASAAAPAGPVTTGAATAVTSETATLAGSGTPSGTALTGWFRYDTTEPKACDDTFGTRAPLQGGTALGDGKAAVDFTQALTGLAPGTTYYYCAVGSTKTKTYFGAVRSLTTSGTLKVTTAAPTEVGSDTAVLNGSVAASQESGVGWFRYATQNPGTCDDSFGTRSSDKGGQALTAGATPIAYSVAIAGLTQGATYYYCALARGEHGTSYGEIQSFIPGAVAPSVVTRAASPADDTHSTVSGTIDSNGSPTRVWFRYGEFDPGTCDDTFGSRAAALDAPKAGTDGTSPLGPEGDMGAYTAPLAGLKPGVTYYYCAAASNLGGAKFGEVRTFTIPAAAPAPASETPAADPAAEAPETGGCSYTTRTTRAGSAHAGSTDLARGLLLTLPLAGLVLLRRRRRAA